MAPPTIPVVARKCRRVEKASFGKKKVSRTSRQTNASSGNVVNLCARVIQIIENDRQQDSQRTYSDRSNLERY